jgi:Flp pilus assembly protein CpaB
MDVRDANRQSGSWSLADAAAWWSSHRRLVGAILCGIAVVCAITAARPAAVPTTRIWVAARDLAGGSPLTSSDVALRRFPTSVVPAGAVSGGENVLGHLLGAPMRRGEPLTDIRLVSGALLDAIDRPGDVAVPVRVADGPAARALVHAGDDVDVIATTDPADGVTTQRSAVVHDVRVLATPTTDTDPGSGDTAGLLIVAASPRQATALAHASTEAQLSVAVRGPS